VITGGITQAVLAAVSYFVELCPSLSEQHKVLGPLRPTPVLGPQQAVPEKLVVLLAGPSPLALHLPRFAAPHVAHDELCWTDLAR
jgi:hypothetical protein